jgi:hypothetical protein
VASSSLAVLMPSIVTCRSSREVGTKVPAVRDEGHFWVAFRLRQDVTNCSFRGAVDRDKVGEHEEYRDHHNEDGAD